MNELISDDEVFSAISHLKNGKSAGFDGIPGEMFKYTCNTVVSIVTKIFNAIFTMSKIPGDWKKGIIVPLYKKGSTSDPNNYRAISLLPIFSKIFCVKQTSYELVKFMQCNNRNASWF